MHTIDTMNKVIHRILKSRETSLDNNVSGVTYTYLFCNNLIYVAY